MKKYSYLFSVFFICLGCFAQPGKDGALTVSAVNQILNKYIPVSVNIAAGSNTVSMANSTLFSLCPGDLIMIYQAQGATMDITNTASYGSIINYNSAGLYEFKYVQSVSGNIVTTQTTFTNSYAVSGKVQLVKVPQYTSLTINVGASVVTKPWKDTTIAAVPYRFGGLVVVHAASIVNNGTISANYAGFRGGALGNTGLYTFGISSYVSTVQQEGGEKGEGLFGYQPEYNVNGGRLCRGAPINAGGGGDAHNAGGGGGANGNNLNAWNGQGVMIVNPSNPLAAWSLDPSYISNGNSLTSSSGGGRGGYSWGGSNQNALSTGPGNTAWGGDNRRGVGGIGGRPLTNINSETRIYLGGGGGAADINNFCGNGGGNGGGIIYLIATTGISGTGNIISNGQSPGNSYSTNQDGASGGGAGGSIILKANTIALSQTINANGGDGGNQMFITYESQGPGGGGGGGFVAESTGAVVALVNGGLNGTSLSTFVAGEMTANGATQGATGQTAPVSNAFIAFVPIVTPPLAGTTFTACAGSVLNLTTTAGATTYFWSGPNSFTSAIQNPNILNVTTSASGIYTVTQNFSGCLPPVAYTTTVTVDPVPTPAIINNGSNNICEGQSINLSGSGGFTYLWSGPSSFTSSSQNLTLNPATANNAGSYSLTVFSVNGCSSTSVSQPVVIATNPTISINGASVCINQPITISAGSQGSTFLWAGPNGFSSVAQSFSFSSANFNLSGAYNLTVTSSQGCTSTAVATVSVYPLPTPSLSSNSPVCVGGNLNLFGAGGNTYSYIGPNGFISTLQDPSINNVTNAMAGIYTLTATNFGCSASVTHSVSIFGSTIGTLTVSDAEICVPFCPIFSINTNGAPATSASLSINGQLFFGNPVNYCITVPGNYTVNSVFIDASGCISTSSIQVNAYPKPNADFIFSPVKPVENIDNVIFTNTSTGTNQISWNWFFNDNNGFTSVNQNTFYMYQNAGAYPVAMIVKNTWGCSDTVVKIVTIGSEYSLYVPNAFTPDGDGLNDIFYPKGTGITKYELTIFDRWGELLFTSEDFYKGWDGTYKGVMCKTDTYTWKINVNDPEGRNREYVGHVTLYK